MLDLHHITLPNGCCQWLVSAYISEKIKSLLKLVTSPHCIFVKKGSLIVSQFDLLGQNTKKKQIQLTQWYFKRCYLVVLGGNEGKIPSKSVKENKIVTSKECHLKTDIHLSSSESIVLTLISFSSRRPVSTSLSFTSDLITFN